MPEEHDYNEEAIVADIQECRKRGKKNYIIINAEGIGDSMKMAKTIEEATGMETRATVLGHMQRGGSPPARTESMHPSWERWLWICLNRARRTVWLDTSTENTLILTLTRRWACRRDSAVPV